MIFFLVTTTFPNDKGIVRKLPVACPEGDCSVQILDRNLFSILLNNQGALLVNGEVVSMEKLKEEVTYFITNNGGGLCGYCEGLQKELYSVHPTKAVISIQSGKNSRYKDYIALQNTLSGIYFELREAYVQRTFQKSFLKLTDAQKKEVVEAYPIKIIETAL